MQSAIFNKTSITEEDLELDKKAKISFFESLVSSLGGSEAQEGFSVIDRLNKITKEGLSTVRKVDYHYDFELLVNDLDELLLQVDVVKSYKEVESIKKVADFLNKLGDILTIAGTTFSFANEVYEAQLLQAMSTAQARMRLLTLKELADNGAFNDPAAKEGIYDAITTFDELQDSQLKAWLYIKENFSSIKTLSDLKDAYDVALSVGNLFPNLGYLGSYATKISKIQSGLTGASGDWAVRGGVINMALIRNVLSLDSTLKALRFADVTLTMCDNIKYYLRNNSNLNESITSNEIDLLIQADQIRYYLHFLFFKKSLNIFSAEAWDVFNFAMLDVLGGLRATNYLFTNDSLQEAQRVYGKEESFGKQRSIDLLDTRGGIRNDIWHNLDCYLDNGIEQGSFIRSSLIPIESGNADWVYLEIENKGGGSDSFYATVSLSNGLQVIDQTSDGLSGEWFTYDPDGDSLIWHKDDVSEPSVSPEFQVFEFKGSIDGNTRKHIGLRIQPVNNDVHWLKARIAFAS